MRPLLRSQPPPPPPPLLPVDTRTHTHAHTQHNLLSLSPLSRGVAGCRSLNQARPILPTPSSPLRATIPTPATLSWPGLWHSISPPPPRPASPLPGAGATISVGVGFGGAGAVVADLRLAVVPPFTSSALLPPSSRSARSVRGDRRG